MTYDQTRSAEELRMLQPSLQRFVQNYKADRPTIILLPGGMASGLQQAKQGYGSGVGPFTYQSAWLPIGLLCGGAPDLAMAGDIDWQQHITVALGTIAYAGVNPYSGFELWCSLSDYNCFVLGWDWRRELQDSVDFFAQTFVPVLRTAIWDQYNVDPFDGATLIGHSFGGLVVKLLMNRNDALANQLALAVTVGTPLYGYGGSQHFWFAGQDYLNPFYSKREIAEIIGSMLGPYTLFFLDLPTYQRDAMPLANDPYPLPEYPSIDAQTGVPADPYNPQLNGSLMRYPDGGWFNAAELAVAKGVRADIAAPLPAALTAKFYNIRGIQEVNGQVQNETIVGQTWDWIAAGFDPDTDADPITSFCGPGDDTIPAWSARLASTPSENVISVTGNLDHMTLMDNPLVLDVLGNLVSPGSIPFLAMDLLRRRFHSERRHIASARETLALVDQAGALAKRREPRLAHETLTALSPEQVRRLTRRVFMDLLKPPLYRR